jgi:hypothetical protein
MKLKQVIVILCLFMTGCSEQVVVVLHNQTNRPIQLGADKDYRIPPGDVANAKGSMPFSVEVAPGVCL